MIEGSQPFKQSTRQRPGPEGNRPPQNPGRLLLRWAVWVFFGGMVGLGLYLTSRYNYLLFHTLVELFSIAIGWSLFVLVWNARRWMQNSYLFGLGTALAAAGSLDLVHTLAYKGLNLFSGYDTDLPSQLWIAARSLQALSFLLLPFLLSNSGQQPPSPVQEKEQEQRRRRLEYTLVIFYGAVTLGLLALIFYRLFPVCYVEGQGLTPFKKISEYVICLILLASLGVLWAKRRHFEPRLLGLLMGATVATVLSELAFTFYIGVYDFSNVIGHFGKFSAFALIYFSVIHAGLRQPYGLMFRNLSRQAQALRESEQYLRAILQTAAEGFVVTDAGGRLMEVNEAYCLLTGYSRAELLGRPISDLDVFDQAAGVEARIQRILQNGSELFETRHRRRDGTWIDLEVSVTYLGYNGILVSFCRDITQRKRSAAVMAARSRLLLLANTSSLEETLRATLDEAENLTGSEVGFYHFVEPDQTTLSLQAWSTNTIQNVCRAEGKGTHYPVDQAGVWVDCVHQRRPVIHNDYAALPHRKGLPPGHAPVVREVVVPVLRGDQIVAVLGVGNKPEDYGENDIELVTSLADLAWEIAESKRAVEALRLNERRLATLLSNLPGFVYRCANDRSWTMEYLSEGFEEISGYAPEDLIGNQKLSYNEIIRADYQEAVWTEWQAGLENGTPFEKVYPIRTAQGETRWVWERGQGIFAADGRLLYLEGFITDVSARQQAEDRLRDTQLELKQLLSDSERSRKALLGLVEDQKEAEDQFRRLNRELEQRVLERTAQLDTANKELEAFTYSVSHDLRAPLRALDGFSVILNDDYAGQLDEQGRHYLQRIRESAQRMGRLINDLLDLSRINKIEFSHQDVNLSALAREIAADLTAQSPDRQVVWEIDPNIVVEGDLNLLRILMENLLNNAYKFTSRREQARIQVGRLEKSGGPVYFVRDNGAGFDMEYAAKLYAPFQRLHGSQEFPGNGIGLSIVKRVVTRHGGRLWAEAAVEQGATFFFTLQEA